MGTIITLTIVAAFWTLAIAWPLYVCEPRKAPARRWHEEDEL